jgi:formylglycine-generating enzyme required for sulfatase activity
MSARVWKVFISSTYLDNIERRKTVEQAVMAAGMLPVGMERFGAKEEPTTTACQTAVRECDLLVGIVAHRYGWIPAGEVHSISELEYAAAHAEGLPRLMFEIDPSDPVHIERDLDSGTDRWLRQEKLEAFKKRYAADQMPARFSEATLGMRVLQSLKEWGQRQQERLGPVLDAASSGPAGDDDEIALYLRATSSAHDSIALQGFKTRLRVRIELEEIYVPLMALVDLRANGPAEFADAEDAHARLMEEKALREVSMDGALDEALARKRRGLVVLGDPGSGKTTHLKRLLLACASRSPLGQGLPGDLVPVFLPLRKVDDFSMPLREFVAREVDGHLGVASGFGARMLRRGRLLLLFDGLDEVAHEQERRKAASWIEEAGRWPSCFTVVTCRFAGYTDAARLSETFLELHLRPMSKELADEFIRKWYRIVETALAPDPGRGAEMAHARAEQLITELGKGDYRAARVVEMVRNPLLLANLCLVHRDRGHLPQGRRRLYEECVEVLLERWREGKALSVNVTAEQGRRVLQPAALWMHGDSGRTRATAAELEPVLEPALRAVRWSGGGARGFLRTVRDESGLLTGWAGDQYGFMHLGFQEYLAASELRRVWPTDPAVIDMLASIWGQSWWQEVILLLLAGGNPSAFEPLMRRVVTAASFADPGSRELLNLVLEEAAEVSEGPFLKLLAEEPGRDQSLWQRQRLALDVLRRIGCQRLPETIEARIRRHPSAEVRRGLTDATSPAAVLSQKGGIELLPIPGGTFLMGSPAQEVGRFENEGSQRMVPIPAFLLGRYPVTNEQFGRFLSGHPDEREPANWSDRSHNQATQPVAGVSWDQASRFAAWAGGRLPTEAEWEYACRAGTQTATYGGDLDSENESPVLEQVAWYRANSQNLPHPVGDKGANPWGLCDMLGNVWEWCSDSYNFPFGYRSLAGPERVLRGGAWYDVARSVRAAVRVGRGPQEHPWGVGFRLAANQSGAKGERRRRRRSRRRGSKPRPQGESW